MLEEDRQPPPAALQALPVFPLPNAVLLPGMLLPLNVFEPRYLELVDHALEHGRHVGVPLLRPGYERDYEGRPPIEPVFGLGRLVSHQRLPDGRRFIRLEGLGRVRALRELKPQHAFRLMEVEALHEEEPRDQEQLEVLKAQLERITRTLDGSDAEMVRCVLRISDQRVLVWAVTAIIPTLGLVLPEARNRRARCQHLELQQRCLSSECMDARIRLLIGRTQSICDTLGESGRFPCMLRN